ncbi:FAD-dependent oxidoreductase [Solimonas marina]|uniref:GMC family oxidoreductase n=1 Tax=Solimonas marina TaxID=2714601 RepID=A0A970B451_9GAMM|nr:GMC family oxidoreductase [Solimonas marina]NKF21967.1 GMC family oxidoreductase [Solimonas marina]
MLIDFREEDAPLHYEGADVCIVGSGAAGLSLARRLLSEGRHVLLIESGGTDYAADTAALNDGRNTGFPYYELEDARLRFFGGTTAIWGGRCAELDAIDFERRDWVAWSGWPFDKSMLAPWYDAARTALGLPSPTASGNAEALGFDRHGTELVHWQFDERADRFGFATNRDLIAHPNLRVLLNATVTEVLLDFDGSTVSGLRIAALDGRVGVVEGRSYVLAAGGLENPRLLLASRSRQAQGVGNTHDLVGRFFMEHPHARGGRLQTRRLWQTLKLFQQSHAGGQRQAATLRASDELQQTQHILNSSFVPRVRLPADGTSPIGMRLYSTIKHRVAPTRNGRLLWRTSKRVASWIKRGLDPLRPWSLVQFGGRGLYLSVRAEQAPNPDSRVTLGDECDALGMPKLQLNWRLSEIDKRTVRTLALAVDAGLRRRDLGHVEPAAWLDDPQLPWEIDPLIGQHPIGGYHHIGTTRMAASARRGVVDADCRIHGIDNLFVAGSSVFPTSGWANPTLTIVALALRLADHLHNHVLRVATARDTRAAPPLALY